MEFEKFNPNKHSVETVANLIYEVDFRTFDSFYENKNKACKDIARRLLTLEEDYLYTIVEKGKLIGIISFYIHKKPTFIQTLKEFTSFKLLAIDILDYFVLSDVERGDVYIAELSISSECRGKGTGTKVINQVIDYGKNNNYNKIKLDADFRNTEARKLYEKLGFKIFNQKKFLKRGMYNMEYKLSSP